MGYFISFTGVVTFPNTERLAQVVESVPDDRILLETDCPYMAPVPHRGKRCTSDMIAITAEKIAEARNTDVQQLIDKTKENALILFGI